MGTLTNNNIRSEDVSMRFFSAGNAEVLTNTLDFTVTEMASVGADSLNGQKTDDPYSVHNYWDIDYNGTQLDTSMIDELLGNLAAKKAGTGENPGVVTLAITNKKGVTTIYTFSGITRKPQKLSASGRVELFKMGSGFMCKLFQKV